MSREEGGFHVKIELDRKMYSAHMAAMKPDLLSTVGRSKTRVEEDEDTFYIYIWSPDTVSLRAALGSITRWFKVINEVLEVLG